MALPARDRHRRRAARLPPTRVAATAGVKALYRSEVAEQIGADACSSGCAGRSPPAPPAGASSSAPHGSRSPPCSSPTCSPRRATGSRWPTVRGPLPVPRRPGLLLRRPALAEAKLDGLREKAALRELAGRVLPATIAGRGKQPYRAPEVELFFAEDAPAWVDEALSPAALGEGRIWDPQRVEGLAATLPRRPRHRDARGDGPDRGARPSSGIGRSLASRSPTTVPKTIEPRVRIDRTNRPVRPLAKEVS